MDIQKHPSLHLQFNTTDLLHYENNQLQIYTNIYKLLQINENACEISKWEFFFFHSILKHVECIHYIYLF
jgi:hypothetical protein